MKRINSCNYPELSKEFNDLFSDNETQFIVVGVCGKSNLKNCNKMACFDLFDCHAAFIDNETERKEGIKFYHEVNSKIIYVHFNTSFDSYINRDLMDNSEIDCFLTFNSQQRISFARSLLLATQICHIVVMVETSSSFDTSQLSIFKGLKIIRESFVLKFLPKLLKNSTAGSYLGKEVRLCSPRFLFFFEKAGRPIDDLTAHEIEMEDSIYQMLRTNFIITNNAQQSLFSIPKNKKFLYVNTDDSFNSDPIADSLDLLLSYIDGTTEDDDIQIKPYRGYGMPYADDVKTADFDSKKKRTFMSLLMDHVDDAFQGFDDSISKYRGKCHFARPAIKTWFETFKWMHKIFIENPNNSCFEAKDPDYKSFLENFTKVLDIDVQFFNDACDYGFELALSNYSELLPHHYSKLYHESKLEAAIEVFQKYARGPESKRLQDKLEDNCATIWMNGKQQCELLSLRGNPCVMILNHATSGDDPRSMHSSGVLFVSTCNCGKTQGRRDDPYTIKKANYEFYELMRTNCTSCEKSESVEFAVFVPSSAEFRAAEITNKNLVGLILSEYSNKTPDEKASAHQLTQASESDLSLGSSDDKSSNDADKKHNDSDDEIVVKIGALDLKEEQSIATSTTEYLASMPLLTSPPGLLPQFPSWSLQCIASSSFYSHNTGLTESQMPGFLSGTNFLLCWEVKIRLEHAKSWAENYEARSRNRKKQKQPSTQSGTFFTLKIFVGMEYECGRGHRFMMSSNNTIMRGISGGSKNNNCGSKVVFSDMPLYYPCPCKNSADARVGQLMRIHIVTPKAPVNINIDPRVRIRRETEMVFTTGWSEPYSLSQSAYWVLRLPYVFQGENEPIPQPEDVPASTEALRFGCLLQGMFGIKEKDSDEAVL